MSSPGAAPVEASLLVRDPRAIAFLCTPANLDVVGALMEREQSVGELAERLQMPIKNLAARVYRALQLGLARQTGEQARSGRPIKRYRSVAERFVLCMPDGSADGLMGLQKARLDPFLDRLVASQIEHMRNLAKGPLAVHIVYDPAAAIATARWCVLQGDGSAAPLPERPFHHAWGHFQLAPEDTAAFVRDMQAVMERYMARNTPDGEAVMWVGSVVPVRVPVPRPRGRG